jgi:hypothetical protein
MPHIQHCLTLNDNDDTSADDDNKDKDVDNGEDKDGDGLDIHLRSTAVTHYALAGGPQNIACEIMKTVLLTLLSLS